VLLQIFNEIVVSKKKKNKGDNFHKAKFLGSEIDFLCHCAIPIITIVSLSYIIWQKY